jgi:hypothetical protein
MKLEKFCVQIIVRDKLTLPSHIVKRRDSHIQAWHSKRTPSHIVNRIRDCYFQAWHSKRTPMNIPGLYFSKCQIEKVETRIWNPEVAIQIITQKKGTTI